MAQGIHPNPAGSALIQGHCVPLLPIQNHDELATMLPLLFRIIFPALLVQPNVPTEHLEPSDAVSIFRMAASLIFPNPRVTIFPNNKKIKYSIVSLHQAIENPLREYYHLFIAPNMGSQILTFLYRKCLFRFYKYIVVCMLFSGSVLMWLFIQYSFRLAANTVPYYALCIHFVYFNALNFMFLCRLGITVWITVKGKIFFGVKLL
jgi:hypothetical protein